jgi:hypothetical protein
MIWNKPEESAPEQGYHLRLEIEPNWYHLSKLRLNAEELADLEAAESGFKNFSRIVLNEFYAPTDYLSIRQLSLSKNDGSEHSRFVESFDLTGTLYSPRKTTTSTTFDVSFDETGIWAGHDPSGFAGYMPVSGDCLIRFPTNDLFEYFYLNGGTDTVLESSTEKETIGHSEVPKVSWTPKVVSALEKTGFIYSGLDERGAVFHNEKCGTYFTMFLKIPKKERNERLHFLDLS